MLMVERERTFQYICIFSDFPKSHTCVTKNGGKIHIMKIESYIYYELELIVEKEGKKEEQI